MALASLVSLTSISPRITASTNFSTASSPSTSVATMKTALAVLRRGRSSSWASASIVGVSGVAIRSIPAASSRPAASFLKRAIWRLAA